MAALPNIERLGVLAAIAGMVAHRLHTECFASV
eukprot:COSAG05_NODE_20475_length_279_cov_0.577778_1_plen_32_part_10